MSDNVTEPMLPHDVLAGRRIALSVSESPDLERLGLLDAHLRFSLAEIARAVVIGGGHLAYGGHLRPGGYTTFLVAELERRFRRENLISLYIAWSVHREMSLQRLREIDEALPIAARLTYLDAAGLPIDDPSSGRDEEPSNVPDEERLRGFTGMRRTMTEQTHARVLIGGKRSGFSGQMPGLVEEALLAIEADRPLFLAAGFGGATLDIATALGVETAWLPTVDEEVDPRMAEGLRLLSGLDRPLPPNGLSDEENRRLTASYRPGEIAALISLGVGRLAEHRSESG